MQEDYNGQEEFPGEYVRLFSQLRWITMDQEHVLVQYVLLPAFILPTLTAIISLYGIELLLRRLSLLAVDNKQWSMLSSYADSSGKACSAE